VVWSSSGELPHRRFAFTADGLALVASHDRTNVYLDTNTMILMGQSLDGRWAPDRDKSADAPARLAAARLFLYGVFPRIGWSLLTSGDALAEVTANGREDWTAAFIRNVDRDRDAPPRQTIEGRADVLISQGVNASDAIHLAHADLRPWVDCLVTHDQRFLRQAMRSDKRETLDVIRVEDAAERLAIQPGEEALIEPVDGPLVHAPHWWVP
jgi:hypothetical protein